MRYKNLYVNDVLTVLDEEDDVLIFADDMLFISQHTNVNIMFNKGRPQNSLPLTTNLSQKLTQLSNGISYQFVTFAEV